MLAADADRRRIERELHDGAQQDLVGLAVKLQQARGLVDSDPAAAGVLVDEMRGDVQESLDRLRSLAQWIHPPQLEAGGLPAALRSAAANAGVRVRIDVGANGVYPQEVSATVYLCIVAAFERLVTGTTAAIGIREITERWRSRSSPRTQASTRPTRISPRSAIAWRLWAAG